MNIAARMKAIRELKGYSQTSVAATMDISVQAYHVFEQGTSEHRIDTLERFCAVMNVQLPFLLAASVPITEETLEKFGEKKYNELIHRFDKMEVMCQALNHLVGHDFSDAAWRVC